MVGCSRFISTAALKCAHLDKANTVIPAVLAEKVSTSISVLTWQNLWRCCVISNNHLPPYPFTEKREVAVTTVEKDPRMVMTVGPLLMGGGDR